MSVPKKFINDPANAVSEFATSLLLTRPNTLQKLANHDVLLTNPVRHDRVHVLSGGGSGHEPSHAGWISPSMLSGAVLGGAFASPSVSSVLAAVRAVTVPDSSEGGCLLIVKNYTGDRLNFGTAAEKAAAEGRRVATVMVADDCALPRTKGATGARGLAGTVFVHKCAGAAAARGATLEEAAGVARAVAARVGSVGVALDSVTVPGAAKTNDRLSATDRIEIGLGIHGEAGVRQSPLLSAEEIGKIMVDTIVDFGYGDSDADIEYLKKGDAVALMMNNLGGASNFEMGILTKGVVEYLENEKGINVTRVYVGSFMTSFDMRGASATIFKLDQDGTMADLLDYPCDAPAWTNAEVWTGPGAERPSLTILPEVPPPAEDPSDSAPVVCTVPEFPAKASAAIRSACDALIRNEPDLTEWDTVVGDGDCGLTLKRGASAVLSRLDAGSLTLACPRALFSQLADAVSDSMGGTSGALLEILFRVASATAAEGPVADEAALRRAFRASVAAASFYGGARVGSRTMVDALAPAAEAAEGGGAREMARAARRGAESTAAMTQASAGRSNYLSEEQLEGTPDPGAMAVAFVLEAVADAVSAE